MKEKKIIFIDGQGVIRLLVTTNDKTLKVKSIYKKIEVPNIGDNWKRIENQEKWKCILNKKGEFHYFEPTEISL